jgi:hypothetical protein
LTSSTLCKNDVYRIPKCVPRGPNSVGAFSQNGLNNAATIGTQIAENAQRADRGGMVGTWH